MFKVVKLSFLYAVVQSIVLINILNMLTNKNNNWNKLKKYLIYYVFTFNDVHKK